MMVWGPMNVLSISRQLRESAQQVAPTVRKRGCEESSVVVPDLDGLRFECVQIAQALCSILSTSSRCSSSPTTISLANSFSKKTALGGLQQIHSTSRWLFLCSRLLEKYLPYHVFCFQEGADFKRGMTAE